MTKKKGRRAPLDLFRGDFNLCRLPSRFPEVHEALTLFPSRAGKKALVELPCVLVVKFVKQRHWRHVGLNNVA